MQALKASELVLAPNGSLYHINMTGETLADDILLVGDPHRVEMFRAIFDKVEYESENREIRALTGSYHGHRYTAMSTGMGCDNIDIVVTELDAAANIDLERRTVLPKHRSLNMVRIGTSGSLHSDIKVGTLVASAYAIGMDGLLNYYEHDDSQLEEAMTEAFLKHMQLPDRMCRPYCAKASTELLQKVAGEMTHGITATAPGFYAPQGRHIRIAPTVGDLNERLASFRWDGLKVTNLEMESSAIFGLSSIMGHHALTVCLIIANRADGTFLNEYHQQMRESIVQVMENLTR